MVTHTLHTRDNEGMVMLLNLPAIHWYRLWHAPAGGRPAPKTHQGPQSLADIAKWMPAAEVVHLIHKAEQEAQAQMQQRGVTVDTSRDMHDAALAAMTFSHLPPVRLSCIRSLVVPTYTGPCLHDDCKETGCQGNRLSIVSESPLLMHISLPHHKNARKWGHARRCWSTTC